MGLLHIATAAVALLGSTAAAPSAVAAKVCDAATSICYNDYTLAGPKITWRIAIPDAATAAPFDVLLSVIAPINVGWAGFAWGGAMANNPLTLGWASGAKTIVSSRIATGHTAPTPYTGASYTVLPGSKANATHWQLDVLCKGCSQWTAAGRTVSLNPTATNQRFAVAYNTRAPTTPASNTSAIMYHTAQANFAFDLRAAKLPRFAELVAAYQGTGSV